MVSTDALYQIYLSHGPIFTDSRNIIPGGIFFALKGGSFDGNLFASKALETGAAFAVVDDPSCATDRCLLVPDVLEALQSLAVHHRSQLNIPVIALTGSNGKTTTKELLRSVLAVRYETFATHGNLNNHIGVPLSVLAINKTHELAIIEMGANHQGEIASLCEIARPTHGVITNIGLAHLEGFGGPEGVKKGKGELFNWLAGSGGMAFVNTDSSALVDMAKQFGLGKVLWYGSGTDAVVHGELLRAKPLLHMRIYNPEFSTRIELKITGAYNFENVLAAFCAGLYFGLTPEEIGHGLEQYTPANNRSQILETKSNRVICDFYNANPSSMGVAIENLRFQDAEKKIAILGDMFELGNMSAEQHERIARLAAGAGFTQTILIGTQFREVAPPGTSTYATVEEAAAAIQADRPARAIVLLKGSRGMALEQLLPLL